MKNTGKLIISLDFELMWGVRDKKNSTTYGKNILGVWEALPKMLEVFNEYGIRATFATVGFLFAKNKKELINYFPKNKPGYLDGNLSPYNGYFDLVSNNEENDKYHFASSLIDRILDHPQHEVTTHTFSHYYCIEPGQTKQNFRDDIIAAKEIAKDKGISVESIVFPRNQFNEKYLDVIKELELTSYRGNEEVWFKRAISKNENNIVRRVFSLIDTYINISGHNCYSIEDIAAKKPFNIPSSRFLRYYSSKLKYFEQLKLKRILNSMTYAAKNNQIFHLWWHPHNFGINQKENFKFLEKILKYYVYLNSQFGFESLTMKDLSHSIESLREEEIAESPVNKKRCDEKIINTL
jgi:peptidoglycan/xylan/chitin deacetylase (PgdA/CDA1 family)